jgi:hypothetical protein
VNTIMLRTVARMEINPSNKPVGRRRAAFLVFGILCVPILGYLLIEEVPFWVLATILPLPFVGDFGWLVGGAVLGVLLGYLQPRLWLWLALLSGSLDVACLIGEMARHSLSLWPVGMAMRLAWMTSALLGAFTGRQFRRARDARKSTTKEGHPAALPSE